MTWTRSVKTLSPGFQDASMEQAIGGTTIKFGADFARYSSPLCDALKQSCAGLHLHGRRM